MRFWFLNRRVEAAPGAAPRPAPDLFLKKNKQLKYTALT